MTFKKLIGLLHLWLGLASGLVVFVIGITGCCYVFINEIQALTQPWQQIQEQKQPYLLPSQINALVYKKTGKKVNYLQYRRGKASYAGLFGDTYSYGVYLNPYTGKILHITDFDRDMDFFQIILNGHRSLWLPPAIGEPIVDTAVFLFVFLLISGLILWFPKNWKKANRDKSFKIKWKATFKRLNYDLHNVLGFYASLILLTIATTGLVWAYEWVAPTLYWVTSGGQSYPIYQAAQSDTSSTQSYRISTVDSLWLRHIQPDRVQGSSISFPADKQNAIEIGVNYGKTVNYKQDFFDYDQYTLKPVKGSGVFAGRLAEASFANRMSRMNYDIHVGQIGGLATKILAFFASLTCASLPITGFFIWYNRKWGNKKRAGRKNNKHRHHPPQYEHPHIIGTSYPEKRQ